MSWIKILKEQAEAAYVATEGLLDLVDDGTLDWKPETGTNWLTVGQLLKHIAEACGATCKGFVTGDWGAPPESFENMNPEDMLPPADAFPAFASVTEAKSALAADKALTFALIEQAGDDDLETKLVTAPWDPQPRPLGAQIGGAIEHLTAHKAQLFYYLKLQGVDVNTGHLWGMQL